VLLQRSKLLIAFSLGNDLCGRDGRRKLERRPHRIKLDAAILRGSRMAQLQRSMRSSSQVRM
jgi:hypothetical protein